MPRLPDYTALGQRPSLDSGRVIPSDQSGEILGRSIGELGSTVERIGQVGQQRINSLATSNARAEFMIADMTTRQELENEPDYTSWNKRYTDKMTATRSKLGEGLSNFDRAGFDIETNADIQRGSLQINDAAHQRYKVSEGIRTENSVKALAEGARTAKAEDLPVLVSQINSQLDASVQEGIFDEQEANRVRESALNTASAGFFSALEAKGYEGKQQALSILDRRAPPAPVEVVQQQQDLQKKYPGSFSVFKHSQDVVQSGKALPQPDGSMATFRGTVVTDERVNGGKPTFVPTLWDGVDYDEDTPEGREKVVENAAASLRNGAVWPVGETEADAKAMGQEIEGALAYDAQVASQPRTFVDSMPYDTWLKTRDAFAASVEAEGIKNKGIGLASRVYVANGNREAQLNQIINSGQDSEVQERAIADLERRFKVEDIGKGERTEQLLDRVANEKITDEDDILTREDFADLDQSDINAVRNEIAYQHEKQFGKPSSKKALTDYALPEKLNDMTDSQLDAFYKANPEAVATLPTEDNKYFYSRVQDHRAGRSGLVSEQERKQINSFTKEMNARMKKMNILPVNLVPKYGEIKAEWVKTNGRQPNDADRNLILNDLLIGVRFQVPGQTATGGLRRYSDIPAGAEVIEVTKLPAARAADIKEAYLMAGMPVPSEKEMFERAEWVLNAQPGMKAKDIAINLVYEKHRNEYDALMKLREDIAERMKNPKPLTDKEKEEHRRIAAENLKKIGITAEQWKQML